MYNAEIFQQKVLLNSSKAKNWNAIHIFILFQFLLQLLLLFPQFGVLRAPMRIASFALSLFFLAWLPGPGIRHPAKQWTLLVIGVLLIQFFWNPSLNTVLAGLAQCGMYLAIFGPLFWVSRLSLSFKGFQLLIFMIWGFHTISTCFGVLQVVFPGQFQPYLSTAIQGSEWGGENLLIILANGAQVYRPMGLTDTPGGAATSGFYVILLGTGITLFERSLTLKIVCSCSTIIGLFCILMSQIRSVLIFAILCLAGLAILLLLQKRWKLFSALASGFSVVLITAISWAAAVAGPEMLDRFTALFIERADQVYYENRGHFLEDTIFNLLPQYPLGAGLGRWGPISGYFGNSNNPISSPIWVEIQWTGWLLDGGIPLIIAYIVALCLIIYTIWQVATNPRLGVLSMWAALVFAYDIGALAITFNYPLFISQGGMEFWLLNMALLVTAYQYQRVRPSRPRYLSNLRV